MVIDRIAFAVDGRFDVRFYPGIEGQIDRDLVSQLHQFRRQRPDYVRQPASLGKRNALRGCKNNVHAMNPLAGKKKKSNTLESDKMCVNRPVYYAPLTEREKLKQDCIGDFLFILLPSAGNRLSRPACRGAHI